jgi:hypothetical protein
MIKLFKEYENNTEVEITIAKYISSFEPRLFCLENYWDSDVYNNQSYNPFIQNLCLLVGATVGHRFFETKQQLEYYLKWPDGIVWKNNTTYSTTIFYINSHGSKDGLTLPMGLVSQIDLLDIFKEGYQRFDNLLFFGSCNLFEDEQFGWDLLEASGSRAVIGYTQKVGYTVGMMIDLLFFSSFFSINKETDPFDHLQESFDVVLGAFPVAKEVGFKLFV